MNKPEVYFSIWKLLHSEEKYSFVQMFPLSFYAELFPNGKVFADYWVSLPIGERLSFLKHYAYIFGQYDTEKPIWLCDIYLNLSPHFRRIFFTHVGLFLHYKFSMLHFFRSLLKLPVQKREAFKLLLIKHDLLYYPNFLEFIEALREIPRKDRFLFISYLNRIEFFDRFYHCSQIVQIWSLLSQNDRRKFVTAATQSHGSNYDARDMIQAIDSLSLFKKMQCLSDFGISLLASKNLLYLESMLIDFKSLLSFIGYVHKTQSIMVLNGLQSMGILSTVVTSRNDLLTLVAQYPEFIPYLNKTFLHSFFSVETENQFTQLKEVLKYIVNRFNNDSRFYSRVHFFPFSKHISRQYKLDAANSLLSYLIGEKTKADLRRHWIPLHNGRLGELYHQLKCHPVA